MEEYMQIPVIKTVLASALTALGKLVSRTSLIKAYQGIEIEGKANMLFFRTRNVIEQIEFRLFADLEDDFPATLVEFEQFRQTIRNCKKKELEIEVDCGEVFIDGVKLAPVKGRFPAREIVSDQDVNVTELPADTLSALAVLAPVADKGTDIRKVLGGINISGDGFTATNGKELSNIPLSLGMTGSVTIPFPLVLLATKAFGEAGRLSTWQKDEDTHFELALGAWTWRGKAFKDNYPNWKRVVPERTEATHYVSFQQDRAEKLQRYLKSIPDDKEHNNGVKLSRLPEVPDNLHLESSNGMLFSILAEFDPTWNDLSFTIRKEFLLRLLDAGHRRIELNDAFGPIVGTGGTGQYIAMPLYVKKPQAQTEQKTDESVPVQPEAQPAVQVEQAAPQPIPKSPESVSDQIPPQSQETTPQTIPNTTTSNKEKNTMNETPTITHTVSASVQTSAQNNEPEKELSPLDELIANIEDMKAKSKALFDDSAAMARKVREVALAQRMKEREYQQTRRTIERIRTASGF
jgi:DNA polymerase III sliding clamp (beta) subunit (PCNA family)